MALASITVSAPGLSLTVGLLWRESGSDPTSVFSMAEGVWLPLPSAGMLVSEGCSVDCRRVSSEDLSSGAAAALLGGFSVAKSSWRLSTSLRGAEVEFRVSGEFSSSGSVHERWVFVSPKTLPHKIESRKSNFMAVDLGTKIHVKLGDKVVAVSLPDSHFCTDRAKTGF